MPNQNMLAPDSMIEKFPFQDETEKKTSKLTVLIVEDHEPTRKLFKIVLGQIYKIIETSNGQTAIEFALQEQPSVVLLDLRIDGPLSGIDVATALKSNVQTSHIKVAIMTGTSDVATQHEAEAKGVDAYFIKPLQVSQLTDWLKLHAHPLDVVRRMDQSNFVLSGSC